MRILYVANHGGQGNDDEGAIAYVLEQLGHEVLRLPEQSAGDHWWVADADLCLFHKWSGHDILRRRRMPKVFWFFDLVQFPSDPTLGARDKTRRRWMDRTLPYVDLGFCTDGDWVAGECARYDGPAAAHAGKLVWLPQGADERAVGPGEWDGKGTEDDLLFAGSVYKCGRGRNSFARQLRNRYADRFHWMDSGPRGTPLYGRALADQIARTHVVLAPDAPVTKRYWSNRVYNVLGFGGFLLHPYCGEALCRQYEDRREIVFYHSRAHLFDLIDTYLRFPEERARVAAAGLERTRREHLYRHRVTELLRIVKERLGAG